MRQDTNICTGHVWLWIETNAVADYCKKTVRLLNFRVPWEAEYSSELSWKYDSDLLSVWAWNLFCHDTRIFSEFEIRMMKNKIRTREMKYQEDNWNFVMWEASFVLNPCNYYNNKVECYEMSSTCSTHWRHSKCTQVLAIKHPRWWRQYVPLKGWYTGKTLQGATTQNFMDIHLAVRT